MDAAGRGAVIIILLLLLWTLLALPCAVALWTWLRMAAMQQGRGM